MNDGQRVYPVDKLIMHHAVSDEMVNWSDLQVQDWFSEIGKARGYSGGAVNPMHEHPGRPGQLTYAQAQYCLHKYTKDGNKYGWRLTELIKRPFQNVAWHAGNWGANQTSIGIETAGNWLDQDIPYEALMCVADNLAREWDAEINGALKVYGHKDWYATQCPGRIYDRLGELVEMINDKAKWTEKLWPAPKPTPTPTPTPTPELKIEDIPNKKVKLVRDANLWDLTFTKFADAKAIKGFRNGEIIQDVSAIATHPLGTKYYLTEYAFAHKEKAGINVNDVTDYKDPTPTPTPTPDPKPTVPKDDEQDKRLTALEAAVKALQDTLTVIVEFFKNLKIGK